MLLDKLSKREHLSDLFKDIN